jgi:Ca-activated chloride channel homolog
LAIRSGEVEMMLRRGWIAVAAAALALAACTGTGDDVVFPDQTDGVPVDPGDCVVVDMSVSSEKIDLMRDLAQEFNASDEAGRQRQVHLRAGAVQGLGRGGPAAVVGLGRSDRRAAPRDLVAGGRGLGRDREPALAERGQPPIVGEARPFMLTPLVIAMPSRWPRRSATPTPPSAGRTSSSSPGPRGLGRLRAPEWGPFRLGKTNPNFSTSGCRR